MSYRFPLSLLALLPLVAVAESNLSSPTNQKVADRLNDQRIQNEIAPKVATQSVQAESHKNHTGENVKHISMTKEELAKRPDLILNALPVALLQNNSEGVGLLFPLYQHLDPKYHNPQLTRWGGAMLAKKQQNYPLAIKLYREMVANQADLTPARLQLAIALFENNQTEAAEDQFQKLRAEQLPEQIKDIIGQYLDAIHHQDRWSFSGGFTYLNDPNINNAPKRGTKIGNWSAPEAESAHGLGFTFNVGKKLSWGNGFYNELRLDLNGKYYWDNKKYNEASGRGSLGIGYQNAKFNLAMLPFMEQTLYAGGSNERETLKRFSKSGGVSLESSYWLTPKWQVNGQYEYAEQRYTSRKHLNGNYHFGSLGIHYFVDAKQYLFAYLNANRTHTRDLDDSFIRRGFSLGWGKEWGKGFSTRVAVSYGVKNYKGPMPIFNIVQRNKELGAQFSIWHRAVHFWGITPRLSYHFNRVKSNHAFYSYDKHRLFVEFSKRF